METVNYINHEMTKLSITIGPPGTGKALLARNLIKYYHSMSNRIASNEDSNRNGNGSVAMTGNGNSNSRYSQSGHKVLVLIQHLL